MPRHTPIYTSQRSGISAPQKTKPKKRRLTRWVVIVALLGLLVVGIQNAYSSLSGSDFFRMEHIRVSGNDLLPESEIIACTQLEVGNNLFAFDLEAATERLEQQPMIKKVLLVREPPETLVITLVERQPVGLINTPDGLVGLDESGQVFPLPNAKLDLPVITGVDVQRDSTDIWVMNLAKFLTTLKVSTPSFWRGVSEICTDNPHSATLYLVADNLALRMRFKNPEQQLQNFKAYTQATSGLGADLAYIDLRYQDQVVVGKRN
ncbi:MAG: FtsQ-type POTRA domain-containing protein [Candidatus Latescibacteria bacterium]|jgi:cell division protein FtsQ|nr:FtsQ-type POTRA domain-containing protein [Candidatus Latescibacterota bacterium]